MNQEEGEELIVFITSFEGNDLRFLIKMAKLSTYLYREAYLRARERGTGWPQAREAMPSPSWQVQPQHTRAEAGPEGRGRWTRALALGDVACLQRGLCCRSHPLWSSFRVKDRFVACKRCIRCDLISRGQSFHIQELDYNWLIPAPGNLVFVFAQCLIFFNKNVFKI